jgi:hypothetical protein
VNKSLSLVLVAILAFGIGVAYAAPMLVVPNIELYPRVFEGPKALFNLDIVYTNINTTDFQYTSPSYNREGQLDHYETCSTTNVNYYIVLNITNTADTPATLYEVNFAAAQNVTVQNSILGGTMYGSNLSSNIDSLGGYRHFGGVVEGVYLDGKWINITWIPKGLDTITRASWNGGIISGPLNPDHAAAFSADHTINGTIPKLLANANYTGILFEGVPVSEYYDCSGNPLITMMCINGAWVDVTDRVTGDQAKPMLTASNMIVNQVLPFGASPYQNMSLAPSEIATVPTWGDWGFGNAFQWFLWDNVSQSFNNTFAPHESRLIMINSTQATSNLAALESGNIVLYASASNYIANQPVNESYFNTVSTSTQIKHLQLQQTPDGYLYNAILADNQTFQPGNSAWEVTVASRSEP